MVEGPFSSLLFRWNSGFWYLNLGIKLYQDSGCESLIFVIQKTTIFNINFHRVISPFKKVLEILLKCKHFEKMSTFYFEVLLYVLCVDESLHRE